jgi:hypothetical protein
MVLVAGAMAPAPAMLVAMFLAYGGPPFALSGASRPPHPRIEVDYQFLALRFFHVHFLLIYSPVNAG